MFALAAVGLVVELIINPPTRASGKSVETSRGFSGNYAAVDVESVCAHHHRRRRSSKAALAWGAFAYIGASLHLRFGLSYTLDRHHRRVLRHRRVDLFRAGAGVYEPARADRSADRRRLSHHRRLCHACLSVGVVAGADCGHHDRARLLHVPQHLADHRHADDAGRPAVRLSRSSRPRFTSGRRRASPSARSLSIAPARCRYFSAPRPRFQCSRSGSRTSYAVGRRTDLTQASFEARAKRGHLRMRPWVDVTP